MFRCLYKIGVLAEGNCFCEKRFIQMFLIAFKRTDVYLRFCTLCKLIIVATWFAQGCNMDAAPSALASGVPSSSSGQVRLRIEASSSNEMVSKVEREQKPMLKRMEMCEEDGETKHKIEPRMGKPAVNDKHLLKRDVRSNCLIDNACAHDGIAISIRSCCRDVNCNRKLIHVWLVILQNWKLLLRCGANMSIAQKPVRERDC